MVNVKETAEKVQGTETVKKAKKIQMRSENPLGKNRFDNLEKEETGKVGELVKMFKDASFPYQMVRTEVEGTVGKKMKFIFVLEPNDHHIQTLEFLKDKEGTLVGVRLYVSNVSKQMAFYKELQKLDTPTYLYGDKVITWGPSPKILSEISKIIK